MKKLIAKIREILRNRRVRKIWTRTVSSIACLVVFVTTYALVLPAITMESQASCGIEAHQHDDSCYEERLTCTIPEADGHTHTEDCYSTKQKLICDRSEHEHNSDCYDENGNLTCSLEEHQHGRECFEETRELVCGLEEAEGHHHDSSCYEKVLTCGKEAHTHSQACYREDAASAMATEGAAVASTTAGSEGGNTAADADGADGSSDAFGTLDPAQTDSEGFVPASDEASLQEPLNGNTAISNNSPAVDETRGSGNNGGSLTEENITEAVEETHPAVSFEDTLTVYTGSLGSDITGSLSSDTNAGNPGNDAAVSPDTDTAAGTLPASSNMTVSVSAEAGTFPAGTTMVLSAVTDMDAVAEAVEGTVDSKTRGFQAVDISFRDKDGNEIEPLKPISVTMRSDSIKAATEDSSMAPVVVHVEDRNKETAEAGDSPAATVVETLPDTAESKENSETPDVANSPDAISFEADAFSVYAIVYTVDFEYVVDGQMYRFSMPGGEKIALSDLIEVLGILGDTNFEDVDAFLAEVESVEFSDPALVKVDRASAGEEIIREVGAEDAEEQLLTESKSDPAVGAEMVFTPSVSETIVSLENDWILTSLQPFSSTETLKISLTDGTDYVVTVTDDYDTITGMPIALEDYATITATIDGTTVVNDAERDDSFTIKIGYSFDSDAWSLIKQYIRQHPGTNAVVLEYDFSQALADSAFVETIAGGTVYLTTATGRRIGTMTVDSSGKATIRLTNLQYLMGQSTARGSITFEVVTDETKLGDDDSTSITFPGTNTPLVVNYKDNITVQDKTLTKTQNADGSYTLSYTAAVTTESDLTTLNFVDTMTGDQTLDTSSIKVNGNSVSVTQTSNGFTLDMVAQAGSGGTLSAGTYTVTYSTTVSKETLDALAEGGSTSGTNSATWTAEGGKTYPGGSTEYTINKPTTPVPVEKSVDKTSAGGGDTVTYTITYGDSSTPLAGFRILDNITDVYTDYSDITVSYNGTSTTLAASSAATDSSYSTGSVTLFDYTFPGDTNGNGPVTVTYSAKLIDDDTAKANNIYGTINVNNTAQEGKNWTTDGTTTVVEYPEEPTYSVTKTAVAGETDDEGNWLPGSTVTYTIVINADQSADMSGVVLSDVMTDLQKLTGDITISYGSTTTTIPANSNVTDENYSTGSNAAFSYTMPNDAGKVAVTITYTTTIADATAAATLGVYGNTTLNNTASAGSSSDGTSGTVPYPDIPIEKEARYSSDDTDDNNNLKPGSTIHYTITYGSDSVNNDGVTILDQMTDIQKLTGSVSITLPKLDNDVTWPDGTVWTASATQQTYTMPTGTSAWASDGVVWEYFSDGTYNINEWARVFQLQLPNGIGKGEITVEYDVEVISEEEALASGITGLQNAQNQVYINGKNDSTSVPVQFEEEVDHNPALSKEFAEWDLENQLVYWNIIVEAAEGSAYPLTDITVREVTKNDRNHVWVNAPNEGVYTYQPDGSLFDVLHAVVTTESGDVLQAGVDYSIDKTAGTFTFPELTEKITIKLAFKSPYAITNGYKMHNEVRIDGIYASAEQTYETNDIDLTKYGSIADEENRIIKWTVTLNSSKKVFDETEKKVVFEDIIPDGLVLLNYSSHETSDPSIYVEYQGNVVNGVNKEYSASANSDGKISVDITWMDYDYTQPYNPDLPGGFPFVGKAGLSNQKYVVTYYTKITDEKFSEITSSLTGSETFTNSVTVKDGNGTTYDVTGDATYEYDRYVIKSDETNDPNGYIVDEEGLASNVLSYKIQINPDALTLNSGNALTLTDYIDTNMDLLTDTVKLTTGDGTELSYTDMTQLGITIAYDDDTRYLTISGIPDKTAYILIYDAQAKGKGTDTYTNTAVLVGGGSHSSKTEESHTIQMVEGAFSTSGVSLGLKKVDQNNITKSLKGAKFELYRYNMLLESKYEYQSGRVAAVTDNCDNPWLTTTTYDGITYYVYDYAKIEAVRRGTYTGTDVDLDLLKADFKKETETKINLDNDTTDSHGELTFGGLVEWAFYYWLETEAPDGYAIYSTEPHNFVLYSQTDGESAYSTEVAELHYNIAKAIDHATTIANGLTVATYANEGTWVVTNIEQEYTSVSVAKVWEGDNDDFYETRPTEGIQVNLYQIDAEGNETLMSDLSPVSLNVAESGYWNNYTWNKLPATYTDANGDTQHYKYTVKEVELSNYSTTYSDNGEGVEYGILTITNTLIPNYTSIYVKKEFAEGVTEFPDQILVNLYVIRTDSDGISTDPAPSGYTGALTAAGDWSFSWDKLPTKDDDGNKLTYTVVEDLADLEGKGFNFAVVYSDNGEGVLSSTEEDPLVITNSPLGSVQVTKTFSGIDQLPGSFQITNNYNSDVFTVSSAGRTGTGTALDPYVWTIEDVPVGTEVTFTETGITVDGYNVTITANGVAQAEGSESATATAISAEAVGDGEIPTASFVNTYSPELTDFEFTKEWHDVGDQIDTTWRGDIIVTVQRRIGSGSPETVGKYTIHKGDDGFEITKDVSTSQAPDLANESGFTFKITDLPKKVTIGSETEEYTYFVREDTVTGYRAATYSNPSASTPVTWTPSTDEALNGGKIINRPEDSYALPSTGGPGTRLFTILGSILVMFAGVLLVRRRRLV